MKSISLTIVRAALLGSALVLPSLRGAVVWDVVYQDPANVGFNDPSLGAARKSRLTDVLDYVSSTFQEFALNTGTVQLQVRPSQFDGGGALGVGGTFRASTPGFSNGFLYQNASTGVDPFAGQPDARILFDFGYDWNIGTGSPTASQFDFFSVALHEIGHAMGFGSAINASGLSGASSPNANPGVFTKFESFVTKLDGTALYAAGGNYVGTVADLTSDNLYFSGPNAMAANGGQRVRLNAPNPFDSGSSVGHLHQSLNTMMTPVLTAGTEFDGFSPIELAIFKDLGWTPVAVPEMNLTATCAAGALLIWGWARKRSRG